MDTNLSQVVESTTESVRYDASVKEVLADKQVLARILKYSLEEFKDEELDTIMKNLGEPEISKIGVDPGQTNLKRIEKNSEEDSVLGEGKIVYDIRFNAYCGKELFKILINIEAQKSTKVSKLGYHLDNRIIYYLSRMISAQKGVEFVNFNYDDIKHVRSIWICMDSKEGEDSINRIKLVEENVYGKEAELPHLDKLVGVIIRLRENDSTQESKNKLIAMLEELLRKESATKKKEKLKEYGFVMHQEMDRRLNVMCNLSEVILEQGIEQGIERGMSLGELNKLISLICKKRLKGMSPKEIAELFEEDETLVSEISEIAARHYCDGKYDEDAIREEYTSKK